MLRPALSLQKLSYDVAQGLERYRQEGEVRLLQDFVGANTSGIDIALPTDDGLAADD